MVVWLGESANGGCAVACAESMPTLPTAPTMPTIEESMRGSEIVIGNVGMLALANGGFALPFCVIGRLRTGWIVSGDHFPLNCRSVAGIAATTSFDTEKT